MKLTPAEVRHIAELARLKLTPAEEEKYATELSAILSFVGQLQEVSLTDTAPTAQVTGLQNVWRDDVVQTIDEATRLKLLAQFPERRLDLLSAPAVFTEYKE